MRQDLGRSLNFARCGCIDHITVVLFRLENKHYQGKVCIVMVSNLIQNVIEDSSSLPLSPFKIVSLIGLVNICVRTKSNNSLFL